MTVPGADAPFFHLEAALAVAGALLDDRHHVGAGGPAEVGQPAQDLHYLRERCPSLVIQFQPESLRLVAQDEGQEFAQFHQTPDA